MRGFNSGSLLMQIVTVIQIYNGIDLVVFHAGIDADYDAVNIKIIIDCRETSGHHA